MSRIISIHSFRGGTGKSNTTANVAALLAAQGRRVCVIDTDIQSPGVHVLFNLNEDDVRHSLNDYLWGKCEIEEAAHDVTDRLTVTTRGKVFLVPSSMKTGEITRIVNQGYDPGLLSDGFQRLVEQLDLDALIVDTHPGLNEETLLSIAVSDVLAIIMRPDNQDFQGTSVTVEVARKLDIQRMVLVVNKVSHSLDIDAVKDQVERTYQCEVAGVLPHSDELMDLSSAGIFALRYPDHPLTAIYRQIAAQLMA